jgi:hypothetical protein
VLVSQHDFKSDKGAEKVKETLATIDKGLAAFGPVKPRQVPAGTTIPYRGVDFRPDGSATLAVYVRQFHGGKALAPPVHDSLTLTEKELKSLTPPAFKVGTKWDVPKEISSRLSRCLSPSSDQSTMPRPEEVTSIELRGRVRAVMQNEAWIGFTGQIKASHLYLGKRNHGEAKITGLASYNFETKKMMFVSLVLEGTFRSFPPYDEVLPIAAVAQWVQKKTD